MKKIIFPFLLLFAFAAITAHCQTTTAMQFSGVDCNGAAVDLFADLDAGKAVFLHYYMPNCGSCPPSAQKIQNMANNIMRTHPGKIKGYAFPYKNTTACSVSVAWVNDNNLPMYAPMDSGATQVAYYGGFGMPTVVLVGGKDHKVMYASQDFATRDTIAMRTAILDLLESTGLEDAQGAIASVRVYPNPAAEAVHVDLNVTESSRLEVEVLNVLGEVVSKRWVYESALGIFQEVISVAELENGIYFVRITAKGQAQSYKFAVAR